MRLEHLRRPRESRDEPPERPKRREGDRGALAAIRAFYLEWGGLLQLMFGGWLVVVSILLVVVAFGFWRSEGEKERRDRQSATSAAESCERAVLIGPYVISDYERRAVMPKKVLDEYRAVIPKKCPPALKRP